MNRENLKQVIIDQKEIYLNNPLGKRAGILGSSSAEMKAT
jgi:hypothetical protein